MTFAYVLFIYWGYLNISTTVSAQLVRVTKLKGYGLRIIYIMDMLDKALSHTHPMHDRA